MFELDSRLHNDTFFVCDLTLCRVLLMNDSQFPWLILVPRKNDIAEIIDLTEHEQILLLQESATVSKVLQAVFTPFKLNIAALGNVVRQLHVHHVARFEGDVAWPKPVWGNQAAVPYKEESAKLLIAQIKQHLERENAK
ncbi:HIT domain-containing protein [Alteromonas sp. 009811495]|uniref:HIT domain-containing protein n=1 Tax=Alteromonas sp. 009811495 TaxID=3002962 RepID=UPI00237DE683|nr:HIT domain-containing protein [Alteromonas sp. 009811495]MEC8229987.1 HIT domain-containing protein [Pseudomonadota bacterium]WDT87604.1 HIT domain-containing protein [Alteromonas sp. 009811495]